MLRFLVIVLIILYLASNAAPCGYLFRNMSSAKMARINNTTISIDNWSWTMVSSQDATDWEKFTSKKIAPGVYTSQVFDQHMSNWCGCCYLVAVVQMLQDRLNIGYGVIDHAEDMYPIFYFDMQLALDTYNSHEQKRRPDWNACQGGSPLSVLKSIDESWTELTLIDEGVVWMGFPQTKLPKIRDTIKIKEIDTLENRQESIMERIFRYGPVVLGIDSKCLRNPNIKNGIIDSNIYGKRDHALTVVGWKTIDGEKHWILRNSWKIVPEERPEDKNCVLNNSNTCNVPMNDWIGDPDAPGYAYLKFSHPSIQGLPSPWYDAIPAPTYDVL